MKKKILFLPFLIVMILGITVIGVWSYKNYYNEKEKERIKKEQEALLIDIASHYDQFVTINNDASLYKLSNGEYVKGGTIASGQIVKLKEIEISYKDEYLEIDEFDTPLFLYYKDVEPTSKTVSTNMRYKRYIPFNENVVTNDTTSFYDKDNTLVYSFESSYDLPIIIKDTDKYGVEFNNQLLYVKKDDVKELRSNKNTNLSNTPSIAVLNYHFFYDESKLSERQDCDQIICMSTNTFDSHLKYFKSNNIFTPTMSEFEMYLDRKIQLPKSVVITIDDGWRTEPARDMLDKYELNGTVFLNTSWFKEVTFINDFKYVEFHSHGDNIHIQGVCPGGQGGAIKCLNKDALLKDLAISSQKLNGTKYFCYPFYEYNSYSIQVLKEAGYTMAFAGGFARAYPGIDKYQIPRYVMYTGTNVNHLKTYIG